MANESERSKQDVEARKKQLLRDFSLISPHNEALGLELVEVGPGWTLFRLPYDPRLVGNPDTGVLHGGAISALLDTCCGSAVFNSLPAPAPVATLDLRIDYLRPAEPSLDVYARADCYKMTRNVGFVRASAHQSDAERPVATAAGTFMLGTQPGGLPIPERRK